MKKSILYSVILILGITSCFSQQRVEITYEPIKTAIQKYLDSKVFDKTEGEGFIQIKLFNQSEIFRLDTSDCFCLERKLESFDIYIGGGHEFTFMRHRIPSFYFDYKGYPILIYTGIEWATEIDIRQFNRFERIIRRTYKSKYKHIFMGILLETWHLHYENGTYEIVSKVVLDAPPF